MENFEKKECGNCGGGESKNSCHGGTCGGTQMMGECYGHGGKHGLKKMILMLIIVVLIFWCGFKLGEITGSIRTEFGGGMMFGNSYGSGMMRGYSNYSNSASDITTGAQILIPIPVQ
ncbi:MAG: hypothetical protein WAV23_02185 [Minisyncoccia bacterium]